VDLLADLQKGVWGAGGLGRLLAEWRSNLRGSPGHEPAWLTPRLLTSGTQRFMN
jgi:hypothetical protein